MVIIFNSNCRCFSMFGDSLCTSTGHRLFLDSSLHAKYPDRDPVMGELLAKHRCHPSSSLDGSSYSSHNDYTKRRCKSLTAQGVLHKGYRYLDIYVSPLRVCILVRVCFGKRSVPQTLQAFKEAPFEAVRFEPGRDRSATILLPTILILLQLIKLLNLGQA